MAVANQLTTAATTAATDHRRTQMMCDGEQEPEEDGQAGTPEIVRDLPIRTGWLRRLGIIPAPPVDSTAAHRLRSDR